MKYHFLKHLLFKFLIGIIQANIMIIKTKDRTCSTKNHSNIIYYSLIHWENGVNQ
jgi:hypothetical protein